MSGTHGAAGALTSERRLAIVLAITAAFLVVEVVASFLTGSLALLSDAGHMTTDIAALAIALIAVRLGRRRADRRRTFGYRRIEVVAAAINASGLFVVAGYVFIEAIGRLREPAPIDPLGMLVVGAAGLGVNAASMFLLRGGKDESLNVRGAYIEVLSDLLGSVAVVVGAIAIELTGRAWVDPVVAIALALWVLPRGWMLLRTALHVLLEGTPEGIDPRAVERTLLTLPGVRSVHDLHLWSITTGVPLLTAHLDVDSVERWDEMLVELRALLRERHGIDHVTLQPELPTLRTADPPD